MHLYWILPRPCQHPQRRAPAAAMAAATGATVSAAAAAMTAAAELCAVVPHIEALRQTGPPVGVPLQHLRQHKAGVVGDLQMHANDH